MNNSSINNRSFTSNHQSNGNTYHHKKHHKNYHRNQLANHQQQFQMYGQNSNQQLAHQYHHPQMVYDNNLTHFQSHPAQQHSLQQFNYQHQEATQGLEIDEFYMTNYYEQKEEQWMQKKRDAAVQNLEQLISQVIDQRTDYLNNSGQNQKNRNLPPNGILRYRLVQFGSTLLNVQDCESDIDLLLVTYDVYFDRLSFFNKIQQVLRENSQVEDLLLIRSATVPLVKFQLMGVKMDLVFAERPTPEFKTSKTKVGGVKPIWMDKDYLLLKEDALHGNQRGSDCLNSYYSQLELKKCIDQFENGLQIFSSVTRVVKFWAKRRGIYNYNLGYLNGISISIMVVKAMEQTQVILNNYQRINMDNVMTAHLVLKTFFELYANWNWQDYSKPVMIQSQELLNFVEENQQSQYFDQHIMQQASNSCVPVLSPTYPFKCTTFQISQSARQYISSQFEHAYQCLRNNQNPEQALPNLFSSNSCMLTSNHFLRLEFKTREEQPNQKSDSGRIGHLKILGLIESRLKNFLNILQQSLNSYIEVLALAESPLQGEEVIEDDNKTKWLSSSFYITLPSNFSPEMDELKQAVFTSCIKFQQRSLNNTIEIGGWINHKAEYSIIKVEDLPGKLWTQQAQEMFKVPWMDQQQSDTLDTDCQSSLEDGQQPSQQELMIKKQVGTTYDLFQEFVENCN